MIEVEVKLKIDNVNTCISEFLDKGFEKIKYVSEVDTYYTSDFYDFKAKDEALRVRESKDLVSGRYSSFITYKGKKLDDVSMSRSELETEVADAKTLAKILTSIGYKPVSPVKKVRVVLAWGNYTVCVDDVEGLGGFLEIEILVKEESEREAALKQIEELLDSMGMSMKDTVRRSYLSMLEMLQA